MMKMNQCFLFLQSHKMHNGMFVNERPSCQTWDQALLKLERMFHFCILGKVHRLNSAGSPAYLIVFQAFQLWLEVLLIVSTWELYPG